jgi:GT2 family glycosyltransferase
MVRARIVVVTYNSRAFAGPAIESALAQNVPCEVVVVDSDSADGTVEFVESAYPAIRVIRHGSNSGFGSAANEGAFASGATCDFVAFLNPDAVARPDWIERTTSWMDRSNVDVGSSVVSGGAEPFFSGGRWQPLLGAAVKTPAYRGERTDWVSGCAMIVRRAAFEALGGFDPAYFLYYEDVDLSLRAASKGLRLGVFSETLVAHPEEGRSADQLGSLRKRCEGFLSKGRCVGRFVPWYALPGALAFQCLASPAINGASLREYPALTRAFVSGFLRSRSTSVPSRRSQP